MIPEELKAHRRAICEALIEGKQCQTRCDNEPWRDTQPSIVARWLFDYAPDRVRIKPEPHTCWVGWWHDEPYLAASEESCREWERNHGIYPKWQLVTEAIE